MSTLVTIYALSFFSLGLCVGVRAIPHPVSLTRWRLSALSAFGLIHAAFEWRTIDGHLLQKSMPPSALALAGASFLALLLFGWVWRRRDLAIGLVLGAGLAAGWCVVLLTASDPVVLEVYTRMGLGLPASLLAACALLGGVGLTSGPATGRMARSAAAAALLVYGASQLFSSAGDFFPASVLNVRNFEDWFGAPCLAVRTASIIVLTGAIMVLLAHFDERMRAGAEAKARELTRELLATVERLEDAQRVGNMGSWDWDIVGNTLAWSDQIYRIFGLKPQEFGASYEAFLACVHAEDRSLVSEAVRRALEERAPYSVVHRIVLRDGTVRSVHERAEVCFDTTGKPVRMVGTVQDITQRLALEDAREAERQLRQSILDNIVAGVAVYGLDGRIVEVNRAAIESTGLPRDKIIGCAARDTVWWGHSEESKALVESLLARAASGERVQGDFRVKTAGARDLVTANIEFAPLVGKDGTIEGVIASGFDVSAREQIKESLQRSEARLRAILDSEPECVKTLDAQCRLLDMNPAGLAMIEAESLEQVQGQEVVGLIDPEYRREYREGVARVFRGERLQHRFEIVGLKGTRRWLEQSAVPLFDPAQGGRVEAMLAVTRDVTERVEAEEALRENREMLAGVLAISPEATIITGQDMRIHMLSAGATRIFGYQSEELQGQPIHRLIPERFRAAHEKAVAAFAGSVKNSSAMWERAEIVGRRKNGEEFPAEASVSKLVTTHGMVFTVILRDITRQKATLEELKRLKREAEEANEAKSRFIANMSHELRTPLNAIIGFSELMARQIYGPLGDARYADYARDVQKSGQHLLSLINDILDISRIEAGRIELREEGPIAVSELIDHCMRWVAGRASDAGVAISSRIEGEVPALRGDQRLLTQILLNLLSNALKFTPAGGSVSVGASKTAAGGVEIAVTDTGIGMSAQELARVGEPFVQFEPGRRIRAEGTGLGISIAKRLAALHGGHLKFESIPGQGTRAALCLPPQRAVTRPEPLAAARVC